MSTNFSFLSVSAYNKPYEWGFATAQPDDDLLWDYWNGPTDASRVASLEARGLWRVSDGTAALPSLSFVDDPDSGFYRIAANRIGLALDGAKIIDFKTSVVEVPGLKVDDVTYPGSLTRGDLFYASADNTLTRLPKGSAGQVLQMGAQVPAWSNESTFAISGLTTAAIAAADKIPFSDESETGDPNRAITFANFRAALNIPAVTPFTVHGVGTVLANPADDDRIVVSDESVNGHPNRYLTLANLKSYMEIPAVTPFTVHGVGTVLANPADDDRIVVSDESVNGHPNRYLTLANLKSYMEIPDPVTSLPWDSITGKPAIFPPSAHNHNASAINAGTLNVNRVGWVGTQEQYDELLSKDANTLYLIT